MTAFIEAFAILKMNYSVDNLLHSLLQKGQMEDASQLRQMRQFVMHNENSADPAKRHAAEEMYEHLTRLMSHVSNPMASHESPEMPQVQGFNAPPPEGPRPVGQGGQAAQVQQPAQHPMMKAWLSLKKNVIGIQETGQSGTPVQYNMPPSIASLSQREQVPEMQPKGLFGRMKPTGEMNTGPRPPSALDEQGQPVYPVQNRLGEGAVQQNPENPMDGFGGMGQMMKPPGAEVTRMPHPQPFGSGSGTDHYYDGTPTPAPTESLAGEGFTVDDAGNWVAPKNPHNNWNTSGAKRWERDTHPSPVEDLKKATHPPFMVDLQGQRLHKANFGVEIDLLIIGLQV